MGNLNINLNEAQALEVIYSLVQGVWRCNAFECIGGKRCKCFDCKPLTLTEACIRYLAGQPVDFDFVEDK